MIEKSLLLGDEAIALGAINAGISGVYAYPGTPSTEITEYIQSSKTAAERGIHSRWCTNEKTAMEAALGMSYIGKRALVCMKHVGMNVAADAFINSAMTGVNGGIIVVAADDPSMHSSQNEQDSRFYGRFAFTPILEPSNQQEAYDMMAYGFDLSERFRLPVVMRITTRMAHSRAVVNIGKVKPQNSIKFPESPMDWVLLPANARRRYNAILSQQEELERVSVNSQFNHYTEGQNKKLGVIACGLGYNYLMENVGGKPNFPVLKISQYPIPRELVRRITEECESVLVLEDGQPFVEEMLRGLLDSQCVATPNGGIRRYEIKGRFSGELPRVGELTPDNVAKALGLDVTTRFRACKMSANPATCEATANSATCEASSNSALSQSETNSAQKDAKASFAPCETATNFDMSEVVVPRPPALCAGCGHRDVYAALNEVVTKYENHKIFSDIGCYTLGALPPFRAIHSCVDMGASITMAKGAADGGLFPSIAVIGDSTFTHSGITGLLDAVNSRANITVIISDNLTTAMTGGQDSAGTNKIEDICRGVGVEPKHIRVVVPIAKNMDEIRQIIDEEINYAGVSVIIPRRECIQTLKRNLKKHQ